MHPPARSVEWRPTSADISAEYLVEGPGDGPATTQIRGSTLLMVGRGISLAMNFATQVLIVRFLSKLEYGAFAYALSMESLASTLCLFGLNKTASRWAAAYHERRDHARLFGMILFMVGTILGLGLGVILVVFGLRGLIGDHVVSNPLSLALLLGLIVLAPIEALDGLVQAMFAVFSSARLIFFRRHVLGPGLKLAAVTVVILGQGTVRLLATAYVVGGALGLSIGMILLFRVMRDRGLLEHFTLRSLRLPVRDIFAFSLPMLHSDLALELRSSLVVLLLEYVHGSTSVASYRAVLPVARLNNVVFESFGLLFIPAVTRLLARNDLRRVDDLHRRSTSWITLLSFPVFAVTFALAQPLTILLFGRAYVESGQLLALLSFGFFFQAAMGLNALTVKVCGKVRHILAIDFSAILITMVLTLLLVPRFGALGAALGVCLTLILHSILNQIGLARNLGIHLFPWQHVRVYVIGVVSAAVLLFVQWSFSPPVYVGVLLAGVTWLVLIALSRPQLRVGETFPEVLGVPILGRLFAAEGRPRPRVSS